MFYTCQKHEKITYNVRRTDKSKEADYVQISEYMDYVKDYFDILNAQGLEMERKKVYFVITIH